MSIRLNFIVEGQTEEAFVNQILSPYLAGFEVWVRVRCVRIIGEIPEYERMKPSAAPIVAEKIGLPTLRLKCKHFGEWLCRLETLNKE